MDAPAYIIVEMTSRTPSRWRYMAEASAKVMQAMAASTWCAAAAIETLEGDWQPQRLAMLRFPSYASQGVLQRRRATTRAQGAPGGHGLFRMVLVEGGRTCQHLRTERTP
jgi:uncharacterized protein (DUF1330 family)